MTSIRRFRVALCLAVQGAISLSPFERGGIPGEIFGMEFRDLSEAARLLPFHQLADRLDVAARKAEDHRIDDREVLELCMWSPVMWAAYDAEDPITGRSASAS